MDKLSDLNELQDDIEEVLATVKTVKFNKKLRDSLGSSYVPYDIAPPKSVDKDDASYQARLVRQRKILDYTKNGTPFPEYEKELKELEEKNKARQEESARCIDKHMQEHEWEEANEAIVKAAEDVANSIPDPETGTGNTPITRRDEE